MNKASILQGLTKLKRYPLAAVVIPWLLYAFYLIIWAAPQYESQSQLIVKSTDGGSSFDPSSLLMSTVTGSGSSNDSLIIESFILSTDMLEFLDKEIGLSEHYSSDLGDVFSRLSKHHTKEDLLNYYQSHVSVTIDSTSSVIAIHARAYSSDYAHLINKTIVKRAEVFINSIGNNLAKSKLAFAQGEHDVVESKLQQAKLKLLDFQSKYNVLDPTAEGAAFQQIAFSLEATLAQKQAELKTLLSMMSEQASEVQNVRREINALQAQIASQKTRISEDGAKASDISVSQLMAQYSNLQVEVQLAIQAYSSSLMTLENARVEAYQQIKHLVTIESPTFPEENAYPEVIYNLTLLGVILLMGFGIVRIVIATIREL